LKRLTDEAEVAWAIAMAIAPGTEEEWRTGRSRSYGAGVKVGLEIGGIRFGAKADGEGGRLTAPPHMNLGSLDTLPDWAWHRPVCLMVDEIQMVKPEAEAVLSALHLAEKPLPIVPLYAGLGNSWKVLNGLGLSRDDADATIHRKFDIGRLSRKEARRAVKLMLGREPIVGTDGLVSIWSAWLADWSDRWPQHLHNDLRALGWALRHRLPSGRGPRWQGRGRGAEIPDEFV